MMDLANAVKTDKNSQHPAYAKAFDAASKSLAAAFAECRTTLGDEIEYPFEHADQNITLGKYMLADPLGHGD